MIRALIAEFNNNSVWLLSRLRSTRQSLFAQLKTQDQLTGQQTSTNQFYLLRSFIMKRILRRSSIIFIVVVVMLNCVNGSAGQEGLEAKRAGGRLPRKQSEGSCVYDGMDNIYIFGG
jgi:hypothetical protein